MEKKRKIKAPQPGSIVHSWTLQMKLEDVENPPVFLMTQLPLRSSQKVPGGGGLPAEGTQLKSEPTSYLSLSLFFLHN